MGIKVMLDCSVDNPVLCPNCKIGYLDPWENHALCCAGKAATYQRHQGGVKVIGKAVLPLAEEVSYNTDGGLVDLRPGDVDIEPKQTVAYFQGIGSFSQKDDTQVARNVLMDYTVEHSMSQCYASAIQRHGAGAAAEIMAVKKHKKYAVLHESVQLVVVALETDGGVAKESHTVCSDVDRAKFELRESAGAKHGRFDPNYIITTLGVVNQRHQALAILDRKVRCEKELQTISRTILSAAVSTMAQAAAARTALANAPPDEPTMMATNHQYHLMRLEQLKKQKEKDKAKEKKKKRQKKNSKKKRSLAIAQLRNPPTRCDYSEIGERAVSQPKSGMGMRPILLNQENKQNENSQNENSQRDAAYGSSILTKTEFNTISSDEMKVSSRAASSQPISRRATDTIYGDRFI